MKPQKVLHLKDALKKKTLKITGDYLITEKLDGNYGYIKFGPEGYSHIHSSTGKIIHSLVWLKEHFNKDLPKPNKSGFIIGELYNRDLSFYEINGRMNKKYENVEDVCLYCNDLVFTDNKESAFERYNHLLFFHEAISSKYLKTIPILGTSPYSPIWEHYFKLILDQGGEGIVLKQAMGLYHSGKRNETLLKMKEMITVDLECISVFKSVGEKGNEAVNLLCRRANGVQVNVVVPKEVDKNMFMRNPEEVMGKIVEIAAMKQNTDGTLREPRFKCIRYDKFIEDID